MGLPHRFAYTVALGATDGILGAESQLLRYDFERGTSEARSFGPGAHVGEAVFVPRHDGAAEDDGWVTTLVDMPDTDSSSLFVLHAGDITGEHQAVVELPQRVPEGFHGIWVPDPA